MSVCVGEKEEAAAGTAFYLLIIAALHEFYDSFICT
jgi:hypothetical protein